MTDDLGKLTDAQREALRLAAQGYESKEIARLVGISHHAVDKRIERALRVLGATDRREAARKLMNLESPTYERTAYEPTDVDFPVPEATVALPDRALATGYPWPWQGSQRGRRLTKSERIFWAFIGLPLIIMLVWGIFLSGVGALDVLKFWRGL